ncbi:MAG: hypothetical protein AAF716_00885 [Cyanobacteria bacterium P01_D01_bin.1]
MTSDASKQISDRNQATSASQEFYIRTIAAWLLLLIPGLIGALVSRQWLIFLAIGPALAAPLMVGAYDLCLLIRKSRNRIVKLGLFFLFGTAIALLLSPIGARIYTAPLTLFRSQTEAVDGRNTVEPPFEQKLQQTEESQQPAGVVALEQAKDLGRQAAEMVQNPPHPLPIWESAEQMWERALQQLESVPSDSTVYEEARSKLVDYQEYRDTIAQRVELEKNAANSYETGISLISELVEMTAPMEPIQQQDLTTLKQIKVKLDAVVKAFEDIPSGTAVSVPAQERLENHRKNYQGLQTIIDQLETCNSLGVVDCSIDESVEINSMSR